MTLRCDDGGGTWDDRFDPDLAFAPDGTLFLSEGLQRTAASASGTSGVDQLVLTVRPGTNSPGPPVPVVPADPINGAQRGFLAFKPASPQHLDVLTERLEYVLGHYVSGGQSSLALAASNDSGRTFASHTIYKAPTAHGVLAEGLLRYKSTLLAFGTIVDSAADVPFQLGMGPSTRAQFVMRSTNGGRTFSAPVTVWHSTAAADHIVGCCLYKPAIAPDGTVYWADPSRTTLTIHRSTDLGKTWTTLAIALAAGWSEPTVVVRRDGALAVGAYRVSDSTGGGQALRYTLFASTTRGDAWQALPVGSAFKTSALGPADDTSPLGPVQGIAATRTGFAAAITVGGALVKNGIGSAIDLVTITDSPKRPPTRHGG
jgi:hypothetical protein